MSIGTPKQGAGEPVPGPGARVPGKRQAPSGAGISGNDTGITGPGERGDISGPLFRISQFGPVSSRPGSSSGAGSEIGHP